MVRFGTTSHFSPVYLWSAVRSLMFRERGFIRSHRVITTRVREGLMQDPASEVSVSVGRGMGFQPMSRSDILPECAHPSILAVWRVLLWFCGGLVGWKPIPPTARMVRATSHCCSARASEQQCQTPGQKLWHRVN